MKIELISLNPEIGPINQSSVFSINQIVEIKQINQKGILGISPISEIKNILFDDNIEVIYFPFQFDSNQNSFNLVFL